MKTKRGGEQAEQTRQHLIDTAIRLMARDGIGAVSLRSVNAEAGCLNASAAHYHFGGKLGLIEAAVQQVLRPMQRRQDELLSDLEARREGGAPYEIRAVVEALSLPFIALMLSPAYGPSACRFIARLTLEADSAIQDILNREVASFVMRGALLLQPLLPRVSPDVQIFRILMLPTNIIYGTANVEVFYDSPAGNIAPEPPVALVERLLEFLEGGITAPCPGIAPDLADRVAALVPRAREK